MQDTTSRHILGIAEMDEQHRYLYSLFDRIEQSSVVTDREATKALLTEIEGYLLFHFTSEECLMRLYKAPGFAVHQTDHEQAGNRFVKFCNDFEQGSLIPARLKLFLTTWLAEHSSTSDEEYARHIRQRRAGLFV